MDAGVQTAYAKYVKEMEVVEHSVFLCQIIGTGWHISNSSK